MFCPIPCRLSALMHVPHCFFGLSLREQKFRPDFQREGDVALLSINPPTWSSVWCIDQSLYLVRWAVFGGKLIRAHSTPFKNCGPQVDLRGKIPLWDPKEAGAVYGLWRLTAFGSITVSARLLNSSQCLFFYFPPSVFSACPSRPLWFSAMCVPMSMPNFSGHRASLCSSVTRRPSGGPPASCAPHLTLWYEALSHHYHFFSLVWASLQRFWTLLGLLFLQGDACIHRWQCCS